MTTSLTPTPASRFHPSLWLAAAGLLLLPAAAMLVTEVNWGPEDFLAMSLMLTVLCLAVEAALRWLGTPMRRLAAVAVAVLVFLLVWAELAVGIFH